VYRGLDDGENMILHGAPAPPVILLKLAPETETVGAAAASFAVLRVAELFHPVDGFAVQCRR
jgi:hypothetical protein